MGVPSEYHLGTSKGKATQYFKIRSVSECDGKCLAGSKLRKVTSANVVIIYSNKADSVSGKLFKLVQPACSKALVILIVSSLADLGTSEERKT